MDLSGPYRKVFDTKVPDAAQIADPLANACSRNAGAGPRTKRGAPGPHELSAVPGRRLLTKAHEGLDQHGDARLVGLLRAGAPRGEVKMA